MQKLQDIEDKIFFETKIILESIAKINSRDELLAKQDLFAEINDRIAFLRILKKNESSFDPMLISTAGTENSAEVFLQNDVRNTAEPVVSQIISPTEVRPQSVTSPNLVSEPDTHPRTPLPEASETAENEPNKAEAAVQEAYSSKAEEVCDIALAADEEHAPAFDIPLELQINSTDTAQEQAEKKFKLAHIKGLKGAAETSVPAGTTEGQSIAEQSVSGSLLKSNVNTDFMQAEKKKREFRLDFNDKVAFSKRLFGGDDHALKETIEQLNNFNSLEEAKQYLSEVYYEKNWAKADEYAQRLWNLVENKFM